MKAFTVLELLIGMVVSAIVLGTLLSAWHIVTKQAQVHDQRSEVTRLLSLGQSMLVRDIGSADSVQTGDRRSETGADGNTLHCYQKINGQPELIVTYKILDAHLIRATPFGSDTFPLPDDYTFNNASAHVRNQY